MVSTGSKKVLLIAFGHPDNVLSLCKALSTKIDIELIFVVAGDSFKQGILNINISTLSYGINEYEESINIFPESISKWINNSFKIRFLRTHSRKVLRDKRMRNFIGIYKSCIKLRKEKFDIIHFNGISGFLPYMKFFLGNTRTIWTIHDYIPHTGEESAKGLFFQKLTVKLFKYSFIQHYIYLKNRFVEYYKIPEENVYQVYSGSFDVYKAYSPAESFNNKNFFLFFGRISKYKGIDFLLEAFKKFKENNENTDVELIIAGSGELWFELKNEQEIGITFINRYIESEELVALIHNSMAVIVPYSDSTHSAVVTTSYAFNKPIIATNVGGLSEVVLHNKTGFVVDPNDVDGLAFSMKKILSENTRKEFALNIKELLLNGHLSWNRISDQMLNIYQDQK